jgi:hypothetical protein
MDRITAAVCVCTHGNTTCFQLCLVHQLQVKDALSGVCGAPALQASKHLVIERGCAFDTGMQGLLHVQRLRLKTWMIQGLWTAFNELLSSIKLLMFMRELNGLAKTICPSSVQHSQGVFGSWS